MHSLQAECGVANLNYALCIMNYALTKRYQFRILEYELLLGLKAQVQVAQLLRSEVLGLVAGISADAHHERADAVQSDAV